MNQNIPQYISVNWEVIKVTEEKGLFDNFIGNKKELIGGKISSSFNYFNFKSIIKEKKQTMKYYIISQFLDLRYSLIMIVLLNIEEKKFQYLI